MKIPAKFVSKLNFDSIIELKRIIEESEKLRVRQRAQAILRRSQGYCIDKIAKICEVRRNTGSKRLDKWKHDGFSGLEDKPRSDRPSILTELEKELVIELARENSRKVLKIKALLFEDTGKRVSDTS